MQWLKHKDTSFQTTSLFKHITVSHCLPIWLLFAILFSSPKQLFSRRAVQQCTLRYAATALSSVTGASCAWRPQSQKDLGWEAHSRTFGRHVKSSIVVLQVQGTTVQLFLFPDCVQNSGGVLQSTPLRTNLYPLLRHVPCNSWNRYLINNTCIFIYDSLHVHVRPAPLLLVGGAS